MTNATTPYILVCGLQLFTCFCIVLVSVCEPCASQRSSCLRTLPAGANHVAAHEGAPVGHRGRGSLRGCAGLLANCTASGRLPTAQDRLPPAVAQRGAYFGRAAGAAAKGDGAPLLNGAAGPAAQRGSPCGFRAARPAHSLPDPVWGYCLGVSCPLQLGSFLLCLTVVRLREDGRRLKALSAERESISAWNKQSHDYFDRHGEYNLLQGAQLQAMWPWVRWDCSGGTSQASRACWRVYWTPYRCNRCLAGGHAGGDDAAAGDPARRRLRAALGRLPGPAPALAACLQHRQLHVIAEP